MCLLLSVFSFSQTDKKKDTIISTEIVDVEVPFAPKITDAFKIKKEPAIVLIEGRERKKLTYNILSVPVASTFQPQDLKIKKVKVPKKERLFKNYLLVGAGNRGTYPMTNNSKLGIVDAFFPEIETYIHKKDRFGTDIGIYANYNFLTNPVRGNLDSSTSDFVLNSHYKKENRYFNWKVGLDYNRKYRSWYGLPKNISFSPTVAGEINSKQVYNLFKPRGKVLFYDSYLEKAEFEMYYFADTHKSGEFNTNIKSSVAYPFSPLKKIKDVLVNVELDYTSTYFKHSYTNYNSIRYNSLTTKINPFFNIPIKKFKIRLGTIATYNLNATHGINNFLLYPDVEISVPINQNNYFYIGAKGDLTLTSFKNIVQSNPYISPTVNLKPMNKKYIFLGGLSGSLGESMSYNVKFDYADIQNFPLFIKNNSKSNGEITGIKDINFKDYEYGNSFKTLYDDIKKLSGLLEVTYLPDDKLSLTGRLNYDYYSLKKQKQAWNLPNIKSEISARYKKNKWNAGLTVFYIGSRKGVEYTGNYTVKEADFTVKDLDDYFDITFDGTYNINPILSVFLRTKNLAFKNYQRFNEFESHGLQIMGGVIWRFDDFF